MMKRFTPIVFALLLALNQSNAGTWSQLVRSAPSSVQLMLLLSDGTVMASDGGGSSWHRLTPDIHGSYANGTWTTLASMSDTRLYFSSVVLQDGRVFVAGGEYGTGSNRAEVYDPVNDYWSPTGLPPAGQTKFFDSNAKIIANGNVLISPVGPATTGGTVLYNPSLNTLSPGPRLFRGSYQDEATWVKLADDSILTIDPFGTNSERYIPSLNKWVNDANVPVRLYDSFGSEMGPGFLLPNGKAIFFGATGHNAIYTPSGTTNAGTWAAGADTPNAQGMPDAAGAMLNNGKILLVTSPTPTSGSHFPSPTSYYEYDYTTDTYVRINSPTGGLTRSIATYVTTMLVLPDGSVMYSEFGSRPYIYKPDGTPIAAGTPSIASLDINVDNTYHLTGTLFNGISEGASYGDDNQMDGNYPIVRLTDAATNVYYCRTFNWSSTGVMTGTNPVTTEFAVPPSVPYGNYSLTVSANGNSSAPTNFSYYPQLAINSQPPDQSYYSGADVYMYVGASGYGALNYQWKYNGANLVDSAHISGSQSSTLQIFAARVADSGNYQVVITDNTSNVTSRVAALDISIPPDAVPLFTAISMTGGYPQMTLSGHAGSLYAIDMTTNFVDWTELTSFNNTYGNYIFTDYTISTNSRAFYRARFLP